METTNTKVIGYIRVSTREQGEQGVSLDAQRAKLISYCELYDLELVSIEVDVASGKSMNRRPGLKKCLATMESGTVEGMVIVKLDRLSRSVRDMCELVQDVFQKQGKLLISVTDQINTSTASGRLVLGILTQLAEWERETIGERTTEALQHLKSEGVQLGRCALGWEHGDEVDDNGRRVMVPKPGEREAIDLMIKLRRAGRTLQAIADTLEDQGYPTKHGKKKWAPQTINYILRREARRAEDHLALEREAEAAVDAA